MVVSDFTLSPSMGCTYKDLPNDLIFGTPYVENYGNDIHTQYSIVIPYLCSSDIQNTRKRTLIISAPGRVEHILNSVPFNKVQVVGNVVIDRKVFIIIFIDYELQNSR